MYLWREGEVSIRKGKKSKRIRFVGIENRVGMAHDILQALASYGVNIITMEVNPPYISVKIEWEDIYWDDFKKYMKKNIKELHDIVEIDMMDYEKREKELQTVVNSMNDGLIAVDSCGNIVYFNKKAKDIFGLKKNDINHNINDIIPKNFYNPHLDIEDRDGVELNGIFRNKKVNIISDIRVIKNEIGVKTGALIILREMSDIRRLMHSITRPTMISFDDIIGESDALRETISIAKSVAPSDSSVMLRGESGTGKELFARAIHVESNRCSGPFVAVNCAAVPDTLLESEFFGYERGAFTGASSSGKQGFFELATYGTLFLDEIGDLPTHLQAKILRAIQEQKIRRIGGKSEVKIDVRIIAATHRNLEKMVEEGTFREDLYYRLNVIPIFIPPLRERREDIIILAKYFTKNLGANMGKGKLELTQEALKELLNHDWPGNVRELQNVLERATILAEDKIDVKHLLIRKTEQIAKDNDEQILKDFLPVDLPNLLEKVERRYLKKAYEKHQSSRKIAEALNISHTTVINKIKKYNICK